MKINLPRLESQIGNMTPIGPFTVNDIGCLTADAAMVATYFGHPITTSELVSKVTYAKNNAGQRTLWQWGELSRLFPDIQYARPVHSNDITYPLTDSQMGEIKTAIDRGYPVFIKIITDSIPEHWMLGVDYEGDDILVADPLQKPARVHKITDYGIAPREVIYAYGWYTGPLPKPSPGATPAVDKAAKYDGTINAINEHIKDQGKRTYYLDDPARMAKDLADAQERIKVIRKETLTEVSQAIAKM